MILVTAIALLAFLDKSDPDFLWKLLVALGGLGILLNVGLTLFDRFKPKKASETIISPDPLRMQKVEALATKNELRGVEEAIEKDIHELREAMTEERRSARTALGNVHKRIDDVAQHSAEMAGELKQISGQLTQLVKLATERR